MLKAPKLKVGSENKEIVSIQWTYNKLSYVVTRLPYPDKDDCTIKLYFIEDYPHLADMIVFE